MGLATWMGHWSLFVYLGSLPGLFVTAVYLLLFLLGSLAPQLSEWTRIQIKVVASERVLARAIGSHRAWSEILVRFPFLTSRVGFDWLRYGLRSVHKS